MTTNNAEQLENKDELPVDEIEIEADEIEEESEAEGEQDQGEEAQESESEEEPEDKPDEEEAEGEGDEESAVFTQKQFESSLTRRLAPEKLRYQKANEELKSAQEREKKLQEEIAEMRETQTKLHERLKEDALLDEDIVDMAKPAAAPEARQDTTDYSNIRTIGEVDGSRFEMQAGMLGIRMTDELGDTANLISQHVSNFIASGDLPANLIGLAAEHPHGAKVMKELAMNPSLRNEMTQAMAVAITTSETDAFDLKFKEVADSMVSKKPATELKRDKPKPNKVIKPSPKADDLEDEEDVIYV